MDKVNTHGGKRQGSGAKPKDPAKGPRLRTSITMTEEHYRLTAGNRSDMIERALDAMLRNANPALLGDAPSVVIIDEFHSHSNNTADFKEL